MDNRHTMFKSHFLIYTPLGESKRSSTTVPVIAGLAVGIGLIVVFAITFNGSQGVPVLQLVNDYASAKVTIDGLRDVYSVGDSIDFSLNSQGYFRQDCSDYCPLVKIVNEDTRTIVWKNYQEHSDDFVGPFGVLCNVGDAYSEHEWTFGRNAEMNEHRNIVINQAGSYELSLNLGGKVLHQQFIIG